MSLILPSHKGEIKELMAIHYSAPKGFVGRQLVYRIIHDDKCYGAIAFGSTTRCLPGRDLPFTLNEGMNNIFFHIEGPYPYRNFAQKTLLQAEQVAISDWLERYNDPVRWLETLVELPRTGEVYKRAGYTEVGMTKGYTCKRVAGTGTDSWTGKRVWDTVNLRPKRVFIKVLD